MEVEVSNFTLETVPLPPAASVDSSGDVKHGPRLAPQSSIAELGQARMSLSSQREAVGGCVYFHGASPQDGGLWRSGGSPHCSLTVALSIPTLAFTVCHAATASSNSPVPTEAQLGLASDMQGRSLSTPHEASKGQGCSPRGELVLPPFRRVMVSLLSTPAHTQGPASPPPSPTSRPR